MPTAEAIADVSRCLHTAPGFPRVAPPSDLPCVESVATPLHRAGETPEPCCWATVPPGSVLGPLRAVAQQCEPTLESALDRAPPDWLIDVPAEGARIDMQGLSADRSPSLQLPRLRVVADFVVGRARRCDVPN